MQEIRFDDVAALSQRVGEPWSPWGSEVTITQDMINRFADVTFDHQWIHIDVERAQKESPLKTTIAHGFFVLSLVPHLRQRTDMQVVGYRNVLNYGADKLRFISPVPAGSVVHARCRVVAVDAKPKGTLITEEIEIAVVGQERPALTYTMLMLFQP
ncbi:MAG: MaoC family dehydratase [Myxococcales bacterium]|nr:MaoC family dehydratase [Myxococcales bacterium]